jgi:putative tryptophan/tyrosine transport system substrate-binding protein
VRRREFLTLVAGATAAPSLSAGAQTSQGRPLIIALSPQTASASARNLEALRAGLRQFGYVEDQNVWLEFRYADGLPTRLPTLAAEIAARKPDVIVVGSPAGVSAVYGATRTIPVVFFSPVDPVALGVAKSLARPGGNFTGFWMLGGDDLLVGKRIELLKEIVPTLSRIGVIVQGEPADEIILRRLVEASRSLKVNYQVFKASTPAEVGVALLEAERNHVHGLFINQSSLFFAERTAVAAMVARTRLPAIYGFAENATAGGLMAYGPSLASAYRRSARVIDKLLKGATPADLPIEQATTYELVVNNKTAKALGLKIPESFLLRADEVIE